MHGHQLDRGHAEALQVLDGGGVGEPGIGAAQLGRDVGVARGEPLDVQLVDDRIVQRRIGTAVVSPVEGRVDHDGLGHERRAVVRVRRAVGVVEAVREHRFVPRHLPLDGARVWIEQQLGRVAALPFGRRPRSMHAIAVALAGPDVGKVAVPAVAVHLRQVDVRLAALVVEQAQLDPFGDFRK